MVRKYLPVHNKLYVYYNGKQSLQSTLLILLVNVKMREWIGPYCELCTLISTFLPRDAIAERGDAIVSRLSVRLSVCDDQVIRCNSSKIISRPNSLTSMRSLTPNIGDLVQQEHPQN